MDKDEGMALIQKLTRDQAENWVDLAQVLHDLEAISPASPSGKLWQDLLKDHLEGMGASISTGHLYKIRRAFGFMKANAPAGTSLQNLRRAKVSSIEVAERLFRLDPENGRQALTDALADAPVPYVELAARYKAALTDKPEMRSPRQLAWDARRNSMPATSDPKIDTVPKAIASEVRQEYDAVRGPSPEVLSRLADLLKHTWEEGRRAGELEAQHQLATQSIKIAALEQDLLDLREHLKETRYQMKLAYQAYKIGAGEDGEIDWEKYMAEE